MKLRAKEQPTPLQVMPAVTPVKRKANLILFSRQMINVLAGKKIALPKGAVFVLALTGLFIFPSLSGAQEETTDQFPFVAEVKAKTVNIRAGQSSNFEKLGRLKNGEMVIVIDQDYSWYKIKLPVKAKSFVIAKYVKPLGDGIGGITGKRVNIRAGATTNSTALGQLNTGDLVRIVDKIDDWYQIEPVEDSFGWVLADYVSYQSKELPPRRVVQLPSKNIYKNTKIVEKVEQPALAEKKADVKPKEDITEVVGMIVDLGDKAISQDIRHQLIIDTETVYFLKGYRRIIDGFLQQRVMIEGKVQKNINTKHPVLLVTKINLIL